MYHCCVAEGGYRLFGKGRLGWQGEEIAVYVRAARTYGALPRDR